MASKYAGSTRVSHWGSGYDYRGDLYFRDGYRVEYSALTDSQKKIIKDVKKNLTKRMYSKFKDTTTPQVIDNGEKIEIGYTSKGLDHFCNTAMLTLSGKYFSEKSMMRIDKILEKSVYVPTSHELTHPRTDRRELWFSYQDGDGRGVYFKVDWNNHLKMYELYDVVDKL